MERVALKAQRRGGQGKGEARALRRAGLVPAIVYGRGLESVAVAVDSNSLTTALHTHAGMNVLIDLSVANGGSSVEPTTVIVKATQRDIFRHQLIHVDFHAISLTDTIEMHVPVILIGTAKGVAEGGVVEQHLRDVLVECLPTQVPDRIEVDITELLVGRSLHASDLAVPDGVKLVTAPEQVVVAVVAPRVVEETPVAAAVPAEGAAAATPAEGTAAAAPAAEAPAEKQEKGSDKAERGKPRG